MRRTADNKKLVRALPLPGKTEVLHSKPFPECHKLGTALACPSEREREREITMLKSDRPIPVAV